jgi:hypothetical protein
MFSQTWGRCEESAVTSVAEIAKGAEEMGAVKYRGHGRSVEGARSLAVERVAPHASSVLTDRNSWLEAEDFVWMN